MRDFGRVGLLLLVVISGYFLELIKAAELVINPTGKVLSQAAGKGFGLTCQGQAEDTDLFKELKWFGPRGELVEGASSMIEVSQSGGALLLMFREPNSEDSGIYNCTSTYDRIERLSASVELIFYQDITWEECPIKQALVINNDGKIRCRVSANPPAVISWKKDGQTLMERYITESDGIKVTGVTEEDKGNFSVRAMVQQTGRFQSRTIRVEVHIPPEIIELEENMEATEGNEAIFRCQASGFPTPVYAWLDPDRRNLSAVEGHIVDADRGILTINSVKRENRGQYTCVAKNPAGEAKRNLELSVIVKPEIKEFNNITAVQSNSATFECRAVGDPMPELNIRKQGQDKPFDEEVDRVTLSRKDDGEESVLTLTIETTQRSDDGLYYCAAENKGAHVERVGHLTIEFSPVMGLTPNTLVKTWNDNPINITCIAEAIPNATISWYFNGQKIQNDDYYTIFRHTEHSNLQVRPSSPDDRSGKDVYGIYKCQADNVHGSLFINIELEEARKPSALSNIRVLKKTATTITFDFEEPMDKGGVPIRAYVVQYHEETEPYDVDPNVNEWSEGSLYILENLKPRTDYKFRFAARNDVGVGEWSDERQIDTPAESAPEPPKFITPGGNVSTYPDRFQIRWTVPLDNGRKIEYFTLRYVQVEKEPLGRWHRIGESIDKEIRTWENAPSYEMTKLKANTFYKVEVRAKNSIGFSVDATMIFQTAADPSKGTQGRSHIHMPGSEHDHESGSYHDTASSSLSTGAILAIIIAIVLILLIVIDVVCFVRYKWGVVFFLRSRVCAKPMVNEKAKEAAFEDGKGGKGDNFEKKSRTEVDNPAFDKEKEPLKSNEDIDKDNEVANEDTPMIRSAGAKDTKTNDGNTDDIKNKSPKGSKSSIAKDSLV